MLLISYPLEYSYGLLEWITIFQIELQKPSLTFYSPILGLGLLEMGKLLQQDTFLVEGTKFDTNQI